VPAIETPALQVAGVRLPAGAQLDDQLSVAQDRDVRVVGRESELPAAFSRRTLGTTSSQMKVLSRSSSGGVDHERSLGPEQEQQQDRGRLLS
jgi:hypothetical protein